MKPTDPMKEFEDTTRRELAGLSVVHIDGQAIGDVITRAAARLVVDVLEDLLQKGESIEQRYHHKYLFSVQDKYIEEALLSYRALLDGEVGK